MAISLDSLALRFQICVSERTSFPPWPDALCSFSSAIANCSARTAASLSSDVGLERAASMRMRDKMLLKFISGSALHYAHPSISYAPLS
jgi:hypothetical protein